jgi:hypothetical protein
VALCTCSDGSLPFPRDQPAATSDANPDFPGSCGRCYQIRCKTTPALSERVVDACAPRWLPVWGVSCSIQQQLLATHGARWHRAVSRVSHMHAPTPLAVVCAHC